MDTKIIEQAVKEERQRIINWGLEICPHIDLSDRDFMTGVISRRECPKCWQELAEG